MQSFLTIFVAGAAAFMAFLMLPPEDSATDAAFASHDEPIHVAELDVTPVIIISEARPLVLALDAYPALEAGIDLSVESLTTFQE